jgi:hypothetical protein
MRVYSRPAFKYKFAARPRQLNDYVQVDVFQLERHPESFDPNSLNLLSAKTAAKSETNILECSKIVVEGTATNRQD